MQDEYQAFFERLRDVSSITSVDVAREWSSIARRRDPWRSMPLDDLLGELNAVIAVMLREVSRHDEHEPSLLELVARSHGSFRRRQAIARESLTDEAIMLAEAFRAMLDRRGASRILADAVIAFLDRDLRLVRRATSAGYSDGPVCLRW